VSDGGQNLDRARVKNSANQWEKEPGNTLLL
jgi:hypothetical protein